MPVRLRQGPENSTAAAFYRQAAERERLESEGAGGEHGHPAPVEHAHDAHETHDRQGHEAHQQHDPTHARPVPARPHRAAPAVHPASYAWSQEAAHATAVAAATHGVDPEVLAAVLAGRGAALDAPLQEAVARHVGAVRVYTGAEADLLSEQAGRMAFAVGESLSFGHGSYRPATPEGQRLLAEGLAPALAHGPGALGPAPRAASVTDGGGGRVGSHGEGVGAVRPLAAAFPFAGTGATGGRATATQLLPLVRQVYAQPRQTGVQPHALVGNAPVAAVEGHELAPAHDGIEANCRLTKGEDAIIRSAVLDQPMVPYLLMSPLDNDDVHLSLFVIPDLKAGWAFPIDNVSADSAELWAYMRDHRYQLLHPSERLANNLFSDVPCPRVQLVTALEREASLGRRLFSEVGHEMQWE